MFLIGCHLSAANGYTAMAHDALSIGANVFQFFTRNPRGGASKPLDATDVQRFQNLSHEHAFGPILAHASYTINPCSANPATRAFALETMADDLQRLEATPNNYYNFHPGSHVGQGTEVGIQQIAQTLNAVLTPTQHTTVLLETMAGKGSEIGSTFEELRSIIQQTQLGDRLGICLDTCHVSDAGYDILHHLDDVLEELDRVLGLNRLKAIHLNDSKTPPNSHKDRHEKIGEGTLGLEFFETLINHPRLRDLPFFLETPNELPGYAHEITLLKSLRHSD